MGYELGGVAEKLGNRYEGLWVAKKLIELLNEKIKSVTVELIGPNEKGVDLLVVSNDGTQKFQQCKGRYGSNKSWNISGLKFKGILSSMRSHLSRDPGAEFNLISAISFQNFSDICNSARNSNNNSKDFYQNQICDIGRTRQKIFESYCKAIELDTNIDNDLKKALDYLKRTHIIQFTEDQNTWSDIYTSISYLLHGKPKTIIAILLNYVEQEDRLHNPIYADELLSYLKTHNIHTKD